MNKALNKSKRMKQNKITPDYFGNCPTLKELPVDTSMTQSCDMTNHSGVTQSQSQELYNLAA
jgi:hypothetical protein